MMRIQLRIGLFCALVSALAFSTGCPTTGPTEPTAHVQGAVTIGGKPVPSDATGRIILEPTAVGQAGATAGVIKDGRYDIPNAPVGKVRVRFIIQQQTGKMINDTEGGRGPTEESASLVPEAKEDGHDIDIKGDNPDLNFDL